MKTHIISVRYLCLVSLLFCFSVSFGQNTSNKGRDFWIGYMAHIENENSNPQGGVSQMNLYITSDVNTTATVTVGDGAASTHNIIANSVTVVSVSPSAAYVGASEAIVKRGIHVTAAQPVVVYSHIYHLNKSGATLVLPTPTLGRSYYSINYHQAVLSPEPERATSQFMIVALEDNTVLEITPTANTLGGRPAGQTFSPPRPLMKGEVYQVRSFSDLSGSKVESVGTGTAGSCKRIAFFSGSSYTYIPTPYNCSGNASGDNLYQQLYPVSAWGRNFVTAPFQSRFSGEIYRVLASVDNTQITVNGQSVTRNKGKFYEFEGDSTHFISASQPVQVTQYTKSQGCDGVLSDADMVLINPVEQTLKDITLYSSPNYQISSHFINVTMKAQDTATFRLDGRKVLFSPVPQNTLYAYSQNSVFSGNHTLKADSGFNALAYGFGNVESYAYSAGANVTNLTQNITVLSDSICENLDIKFKGFAAYEPLAWKWDFGDGSTSTNPSPAHRFAKPGNYTISLVTTKANAIDCDSQDSTFIELQVHDTPNTNFSFVTPCTNDSTRFTNTTVLATSEKVKSWRWDFGDGTTSGKQHVTHLYKSPGTYIVKLYAVTEAMCVNETSKTVIIYPPPQARFSLPSNCGTSLTFQNLSTATAPNTMRYEWDFGDGTAKVTTKDPMHTFAATGTYLVKLKVTSNVGCVDSTQQQIEVFPKPVVNFSLPDICLRDEAVFQNLSSVPAGTLSYKWFFGDGNTSTEVNPRHRYAAVGNYAVKLVVTSDKGCRDSLTTTYTINGSTPAPNFTISSFCQREGVSFQDASSVAFGKVVRWEWNFGDGSTSIEQNPQHVYAAAGTYQVSLRVWSGIICTDVITKTITVLPSPTATFTSPATACTGQKTIFTNTSLANGSDPLTYSWTFGDGTSSSEASPAHTFTTPGTYTVTLISTGASGCAQTVQKTITVAESPTVEAGEGGTIVQGETLLLNGSGSAALLWSPATGLSDSTVGNPIASPIETTRYYLSATTAAGCTVVDSVDVLVMNRLIIPKAFSPNGDNINETWLLEGVEEYPAVTVEIFNRWGELIYSSKGYSVPWNGKRHGQDLPVGAYYYIINPQNGRAKFSGSVTILR